MVMSATTEKELKRLSRIRDQRRQAEQEAWANLVEAMKVAHNEQHIPYEEIGKVVGVTKARVYQVVTGNRGGKRKGE